MDLKYVFFGFATASIKSNLIMILYLNFVIYTLNLNYNYIIIFFAYNALPLYIFNSETVSFYV